MTTDKISAQWKTYAPCVLRIGLALVFLWFGFYQLINPASFLGYIPQWILPHGQNITHEHALQWTHSLPHLPTHILIMVNGIFEIIAGILLGLGIFLRPIALLLALHLFGIMVSLGYNDVAVRDFGLFMATISIFLHGEDKLCIMKKKEESF